MRLTLRTNLAMRTLMFCAVNPGRLVRKAEVAAYCNASENHLAHVIVDLANMGWLHTTRGRHGGLQLGLPPEEIDVGKVMRQLEGTVPFADCFDEGEGRCPITEHCRLRAVLLKAVDAFYGALDGVSLAALTKDNDGLAELLALEPRDGPVHCHGSH